MPDGRCLGHSKSEGTRRSSRTCDACSTQRCRPRNSGARTGPPVLSTGFRLPFLERGQPPPRAWSGQELSQGSLSDVHDHVQEHRMTARTRL